jgi:hypothetical protein
MSDDQSIFGILNLSNIIWYGVPLKPDDLDPTKRHYQCVENGSNTVCNRIYEKSAVNGKHITISRQCPEIFDSFTLSYKFKKFVTTQ